MSTTSTLEFSNFPTDTIEKIIEKCDLKEQLALRKVSKNLRSLVDEQKIAYKSITIDPRYSYISCVYNREKVAYASKNWDEEIRLGLDYAKYCIIRGEDYVKIALNDVTFALNNPKLRLNVLTVSYYYNDIMNPFSLKSLLKHPNHKLHVKTLKLHAGSSECLLSTLRCLKPKMLVNIEVYGVHDRDDWALEKVRQVASLEQWKQAEQLIARFSFHYFPSEFLMHFKRFVILDWDVTEQFLINLRDLFSTFINFESCTLDSPNVDNFCEFLQSFCEKVESEGEVIYRFKIPDESNKMLEFKINYNDFYYEQIVIEKKNF